MQDAMPPRSLRPEARHTGRVRRATVLIVVLCAAVAGGATWLALGASGQSAPPPAAAAAAVERPAEELPPIPTARPKVVEPVAGEGSAGGQREPVPVEEDDGTDRAPTRAASAKRVGRSAIPSGQDSVRDATALANGVALPPLEAPAAVRQIIEAGNQIARSPYKWGGGHGKWQDTGYDCSGSVSFALAAAGLLEAPLASGPFMKWGKPGKGKWVTIYTNPGHMFMEVAGIRFDTSAAKRTGSRWVNDARPVSGYVARHPPGL